MQIGCFEWLQLLALLRFRTRYFYSRVYWQLLFLPVTCCEIIPYKYFALQISGAFKKFWPHAYNIHPCVPENRTFLFWKNNFRMQLVRSILCELWRTYNFMFREKMEAACSSESPSSFVKCLPTECWRRLVAKNDKADAWTVWFAAGAVGEIGEIDISLQCYVREQIEAFRRHMESVCFFESF